MALNCHVSREHVTRGRWARMWRAAGDLGPSVSENFLLQGYAQGKWWPGEDLFVWRKQNDGWEDCSLRVLILIFKRLRQRGRREERHGISKKTRRRWWQIGQRNFLGKGVQRNKGGAGAGEPACHFISRFSWWISSELRSSLGHPWIHLHCPAWFWPLHEGCSSHCQWHSPQPVCHKPQWQNWAGSHRCWSHQTQS